MHSTDNLEDGYLGSGQRLWRSLNKHRKENHKIEILEYLNSRQELKKREAEIVNESLLQDSMCMNLALGGQGGYINEEHAKKFHAAGGRKVLQLMGKRHCEKLKNDIEYKKKYSKAISDAITGEKNPFYNKTHSNETKEKMINTHKNNMHQQGENNSQFGTCWIYNEELKECIKINTIELNDYISNFWKKGRKMSF